MSNSNGTLTLVPPPLGYVVDFTNPKRQLVTQVYTVVVVENLLAMAFLLQRIYTRTGLMKSFQLEDGMFAHSFCLDYRLADAVQPLSLPHGYFLLVLKLLC